MQTLKSILSGTKRALNSYFRETTVHGFRYVAEGENICEKMVWVVIIVLGFLLSGAIIYFSFEDWAATPLQTTIDKVSMPIEELSQPAITVCHPLELQMPRRNRWMYIQKALNWIDTSHGKSTIRSLHYK